jgi:hypothetical protein
MQDIKNVKFQILTAASMKMTVLWDVVPCSLVVIYRRFRGAYGIIRAKTRVYFNKITQCYIPNEMSFQYITNVDTLCKELCAPVISHCVYHVTVTPTLHEDNVLFIKILRERITVQICKY